MRRARGMTQRALALGVGLAPEHLSRVEHGHRPPPRRSTVLQLAAALTLAPGGFEQRELLVAAGYVPDPDPARPALRDTAADPRQAAADGLADDLPEAMRYPPPALVAQLPALIEGPREAARAALLLLQAAAYRAGKVSGTIFFSSSGATQALLAAPEIREPWYAALGALLDHGWCFSHVWQLSCHEAWSSQLISELAALMTRPSRYDPRFSLRQCPPQDLLVVPGVAALVGLSAEPAGPTRSTLVVRDPGELAALGQHAASLAREASPLIDSQFLASAGEEGNSARARFAEISAEGHHTPGEFSIVKGGPPLRFVPTASWWGRISKELGKDGGLAARTELAYRRRLYDSRLRIRHTLAAEMRTWRHREICTMSGVRRFAREGAMASDDFLLDGMPPLSREERADALLQFLGQLRGHGNYELALLDEKHEPLASTIWVVKGSQFFSLELVGRDDRGERRDSMVVIRAEEAVAGFRAHFDRLWSSLPAQCKDKPRIAHWLDRQLEALQ